MPQADFRYVSNGSNIGNFKGTQVYIYTEDKFDVGRNRRSGDIAALTFGDSYQIRLIQRGKWIGNMSPAGNVELFDAAMPYERRVKLSDYTTMEAEETTTSVTEGRDTSIEAVIAQAKASQKKVDDFLKSDSVVDKYLKEMGYKGKK